MFTILMFFPTIIIGIIIISVVGLSFYFINKYLNHNNMGPNSSKSSAKDFFLNLGAVVALYAVVGSLLNLLFTVINTAYPQVNNYYYNISQSISWPVAALIIVFPVLILLMWLIEREYRDDPEARNTGIHKLLSYVTLFLAGLIMAGDLITVLYYFLDGQELTTGFILKVLVLLVVSSAVFTYYVSDIRGKLTHGSRNIWRIVVGVAVVGSIVLGFSVLGSPSTQRMYKYDEQKLNDLRNINQSVISYYQTHSGLPGKLADLSSSDSYFVIPTDSQSGKSYEYILVGQSAKAYQLCAEFNKPSPELGEGNSRANYAVDDFFKHGAGRFCFSKTISLDMYPNPKVIID